MIKITQNGIDTVQDDTIDSSKIVNNSISEDDLPSGTALQTVVTRYTTRTSFTVGTSDTVMPGGTLTITPKANNSKFLIQVRYFLELNASWDTVWNIQRDGSRININGYTANQTGIMMARQSYASGSNDNNSTPEMLSLETLSVEGSTKGTNITFRLVGSSAGNKTCWINRTFGNNGARGHECGTSEVIITEYKG
jgi:hypothetical protein